MGGPGRRGGGSLHRTGAWVPRRTSCERAQGALGPQRRGSSPVRSLAHRPRPSAGDRPPATPRDGHIRRMGRSRPPARRDVGSPLVDVGSRGNRQGLARATAVTRQCPFPGPSPLRGPSDACFALRHRPRPVPHRSGCRRGHSEQALPVPGRGYRSSAPRFSIPSCSTDASRSGRLPRKSSARRSRACSPRTRPPRDRHGGPSSATTAGRRGST